METKVEQSWTVMQIIHDFGCPVRIHGYNRGVPGDGALCATWCHVVFLERKLTREEFERSDLNLRIYISYELWQTWLLNQAMAMK
jgi:hypothetical protein